MKIDFISIEFIIGFLVFIIVGILLYRLEKSKWKNIDKFRQEIATDITSLAPGADKDLIINIFTFGSASISKIKIMKEMCYYFKGNVHSKEAMDLLDKIQFYKLNI